MFSVSLLPSVLMTVYFSFAHFLLWIQTCSLSACNNVNEMIAETAGQTLWVSSYWGTS